LPGVTSRATFARPDHQERTKMRTLLAALALSAVATGCMVRVPGVAVSSPVVASERKCPPGHVWSDGQCHSKGKGHDKHQ
jgi:hypothetical protein